MRFKKKKEEGPEISIAPLIDILFLLLIFFMVTSHFDISSGLQINLPKVTQRITGEEDENRVTLVIDKTAQIYLDGENIEQEELKGLLEQKVKEEGLLDLVLHADKDVSHGTVVVIMDIAKSAGISSIIIAARWKAEDLL